MSRLPRFLCALVLAALAPSPLALLAAEPAPERTPPTAATDHAPDFGLLDYRGKFYQLRRADARAVVLFITGNGCPIARQSVSKIRALRSKFAGKDGEKGIAFWMLNANSQDDVAAIAEEAQKFSIGSIPILKDDYQFVARALGVVRTAEVIAIETKDWTIIYRGAIDDQLAEGAQKDKANEKYLERALTEFLAGQPISRTKTAVKGCLIKFDNTSKETDEPISYVKEVAPLLAAKCVGCHSTGNIGPFPLSSHKKAKGWSEMIREVVLARRMPPWHADPRHGKFVNDRSLTPDETRTLLRWIEQGSPRGEGEDDPLVTAAAQAAGRSKWPLGQPDYVVTLPAAETVPATGVLQYRHIDADFQMPQDGWLRAAACRPDNRKVVHHIIVRVQYPDDAAGKPEEEVFLTSWAPGNSLPEVPPGTGKFLPKGSRFNFEMHYTTIGRVETDRSELGLYLAKERPAMILETRATENRDFTIPPGEPDARTHCLYSFRHDTLIYDLIPHMHLRGAWFQYEALYPDGRRETLLHVPNYDFNWQTEYRFAQPKRVPAGTWLLCTGGYDNSTRNPNNPDPTKRVRYGLQSWEEMFMGFMNVAELPAAKESGRNQAKAGN